MSTFIIACGGTGGHISPGIAVAQRLQEKGHECYLLISQKNVDARLVKKYKHLNFIKTPGSSFSLSPIKLCRFLFSQAHAFFFNVNLLRKVKADMIFGFGGFITVASVLAGVCMGVPSVLHEANRHAGKAIRLMSIFALRVYLPEGVRLRSLPPQAIRHFGFPVREEIKKIAKKVARLKLAIPLEGKVLVILGGSQGAAVLNEWTDKNRTKLAEAGLHVFCITGLNKHEECKKIHQASNGHTYEARFRAFTDDMSLLLSAADVVVSRAGAGAIAEITRMHVPSILIPYPFAADQHQKENAKFMEAQGAAICLDQSKLETLFAEVEALAFSETLITHFKSNLERLDRIDCLSLIVNDFEQLIKLEQERKDRR